MKKYIPVMIACLVMVLTASAQKNQKDYSKDDEKIYNKLANLFTMDKFVKCIDECEGYIKSDNTARSPYPYLYMSMSYFAIHQDQESFDMKKFKDPLRKALSFIGRFKKKDKSGDIQKENSDFMRDLMKGALLECANLDGKKDYKNLQNIARDIAKSYDKDEGMLITSGVYLLHCDVKPEGERNIDAGMNLLKKRKDDGNTRFEYDQADILAQSFILYTDYLADAKDAAKAKSTIQFAKGLLPENEKISKQFEKVGK
ncbi:MAG: hypothetical protein NT126_09385 [Bacteroidetes bacterium]|nr:hypothetical protein [Bacteroidota bacterium]